MKNLKYHEEIPMIFTEKAKNENFMWKSSYFYSMGKK